MVGRKNYFWPPARSHRQRPTLYLIDTAKAYVSLLPTARAAPGLINARIAGPLRATPCTNGPFVHNPSACSSQMSTDLDYPRLNRSRLPDGPLSGQPFVELD